MKRSTNLILKTSNQYFAIKNSNVADIVQLSKGESAYMSEGINNLSFFYSGSYIPIVNINQLLGKKNDETCSCLIITRGLSANNPTYIGIAIDNVVEATTLDDFIALPCFNTKMSKIFDAFFIKNNNHVYILNMNKLFSMVQILTPAS
jgi:chemotaxis signal transduction protein